MPQFHPVPFEHFKCKMFCFCYGLIFVLLVQKFDGIKNRNNYTNLKDQLHLTGYQVDTYSVSKMIANIYSILTRIWVSTRNMFYRPFFVLELEHNWFPAVFKLLFSIHARRAFFIFLHCTKQILMSDAFCSRWCQSGLVS